MYNKAQRGGNMKTNILNVLDTAKDNIGNAISEYKLIKHDLVGHMPAKKSS